MAIDITYLERAAHRASITARTRTLNEATRAQQQTAFLSHSHLDKERAVGLQVMLGEAGWDVYIDWQHNTMDERPTNELSKELQLRMDMCTWLIYLATANSEKSRWCPWEIGYANGRKSDNSILVVPTTSGYITHGSEYLNLYRRLDLAASTQKMALFERGAYSTGRTLGSMPRSPAHL